MTTGGAFLTSREIFDNPIWTNIVEFRLFFLIYGQAVFSEEGARIGNVNLKRGQWLRSIRNLQKDLEYIENRAVKSYSTSVLKRAIDSLVKQNRIEIEVSELGTLFTVLNYEVYQGFSRYSNKNLERRENSDGTQMEQQQNDNNNGIKVMKDEKILYASFVKLMPSEYEKLVEKLGQARTAEMIDRLDNYIGSKGKRYKSHYHTILSWVSKDEKSKSPEPARPNQPASGEEDLFAMMERWEREASKRVPQ